MRPFKFFFFLSLGIFVLLFLTRFFIMAFVAAIVLSALFFVFRKAKDFFGNMNWQVYDNYSPVQTYRNNALPESSYHDEPLFNRPAPQGEWLDDYRTIEVK